MEKVKSLLIVVLLAAVAYLFYERGEVEAPEPEPTLEELENNLVGIIDSSKAKEEQDYFIATRAKIFKDTFDYDDTRSFTLSLAKMQNYVKYVSGVGKDRGIPQIKLGLRFYMGAKPRSPIDTLSEGLSTMFIVPTIADDKTQKGGFFSPSAPPPPPSNIPDTKVQNDLGGDNPPHNYGG